MAAQISSAASSSTSSANQHHTASSSTGASRPPQKDVDRQQHASRRRRELQQQCLLPSGLADAASLKSRTAAWLYLLGISHEDIAAQVQALFDSTIERQRGEASSVPGLVKESLSAPIPLDKDGWQVASGDILDADSLETSANGGKSSTTGLAGDENEWKLVKSKRTRRRKGADTDSNASPPDSPSLGDSTQTSPTTSGTISSLSTSAMSPDPSSNAPPPASEGRRPGAGTERPERTISPDQEQYPNLSARDVEQVAKDVERSFIGPAFSGLFDARPADGNGSEFGPLSNEKIFRRKQLSHLVLTTLSKHPALHYFQGYHDILSVVLLTLAHQPPSALPSGSAMDPSSLFADANQQAIVELVAERISLHLIRDSMTRDLLPIMGQLKLLGSLIRLCDPAFAEFVDRASPLPFFALPWLLTLLTHDAGQVAVMQRVLEFVFAFGPSSAIYLCAAILLERKEEVFAMDPDELEDPAMLHTILGKLPRLAADSVEGEQGKPGDGMDAGDKQKTEASTEMIRDAMYVDPDVELPSLASDRELAAATAAGGIDSTRKHKKKEEPISSLLQKAADLMKQYPLQSADMGADKIMGPSSVLFTWPRIFDPPVDSFNPQKALPEGTSYDEKQQEDALADLNFATDWSSQNSLAEKALAGPTDAIVRDPHPAPPTPPASDIDEKHSHSHPHHHHLGKKRGNKADWEQQAKMLAVVGISGLLVAALIGASQNPSSAASSAATLVRETTSEETKRVLTLIVSLLSNWGRVVGSG